MGKRGPPEISLRGKGRAMFADLTEWVEPSPTLPETSAGKLTAAPAPAPSAPETRGAPGVEARAPTSVDEAPGKAPGGDQDGDGFGFLTLEAAQAAAVRPSPLPGAALLSWRREAPPPASEEIGIAPEAPMQGLRLPGPLEPEALGLIPSSPKQPFAPRPRPVDEAQIRQLHGRVDELYRHIASGVIPDLGSTERALNGLKQACEALLKPDGDDEAGYYYGLASTRYAIARRLWRWSYTHGLFVFPWGLAWLGAYLQALTAGRGYRARVVPPAHEGI